MRIIFMYPGNIIFFVQSGADPAPPPLYMLIVFKYTNLTPIVGGSYWTPCPSLISPLYL